MIKRLRDGRYFIKVSVHKAGQKKHTVPCEKEECPLCANTRGIKIEREILEQIENDLKKELKNKIKKTSSLTSIKYVSDALKFYRNSYNGNFYKRESTYNRLLSELGSTPIDQSFSALNNFVDYHKADLKPSSINRHIEIIRAAINKCYTERNTANKTLISENYLRGVKMLEEQNIDYLILNKKQMGLFWDALDERLKPFVYFAWRVPIREGEAFNLKREHIDLFNQIIKLPYEYTKQGDMRQIKILKEFLPYVKKFIASPAEYLFNRGPAEGYKPLGYYSYKTNRIEFTLKKPWQIACKAAGAPKYNMHKCRQQAVMSLWQAGWTEEQIRLYGGWAEANRSNDAFYSYFNKEMALWITQGQHKIDLTWWKTLAEDFKAA